MPVGVVGRWVIRHQFGVVGRWMIGCQFGVVGRLGDNIPV